MYRKEIKPIPPILRLASHAIMPDAESDFAWVGAAAIQLSHPLEGRGGEAVGEPSASLGTSISSKRPPGPIFVLLVTRPLRPPVDSDDGVRFCIRGIGTDSGPPPTS